MWASRKEGWLLSELELGTQIFQRALKILTCKSNSDLISVGFFRHCYCNSWRIWGEAWGRFTWEKSPAVLLLDRQLGLQETGQKWKASQICWTPSSALLAACRPSEKKATFSTDHCHRSRPLRLELRQVSFTLGNLHIAKTNVSHTQWCFWNIFITTEACLGWPVT